MNAHFKCMPKLLSHKLSSQQKLDLKNKITSDYISSIPTEKVDEKCKNFAKAALKVKDIGFDTIQIHGDRMCGSFTSTIFNKRNDKYNGDIKSRSLFATNSIKAIREVLPDIPIDFKLVIRLENPNYGRAGVTLNELKDFIRALDESCVTSYHATLANHSNLSDTIPSKNHQYFYEEGCFLLSKRVSRDKNHTLCVGELKIL